MQTTRLPTPLTSAPSNANPVLPNLSANAGDGAQFSQVLNREMENRQAPAPAPQPQHSPAPQAQPAQQADEPPVDTKQSTTADSQPPADKQTSAAKADAGDDADKAATGTAAKPAAKDDDNKDPAATTPIIDMLSLVASLQQAPRAAAAVAKAEDNGRGKAGAALAAALPAAAHAAKKADELAAPATPAAAATEEQPGVDFAEHVKHAASAAAAQAEAPIVANTGKKIDAKADAAKPTTGKAVGAVATDTTKAAPAAGVDIKAVDTKSHTDTTAQLSPVKAPADVQPAAAEHAAKPVLPQPAAVQNVQAAIAPVTAQVQAAVQAAQANGGAASDRIAARVGTPGWDNQVGQKIVWMVAGGEQSASLTLNPPDLGPMQVVLSVNNDQANVTFSSAQPEVRQALESAMPKLREMLGDSGIALGNATVNAGMPNQQQSTGEQAPRSAQQFSGSGPRVDSVAADTSASAPRARVTRLGDSGTVDTFA